MTKDEKRKIVRAAKRTADLAMIEACWTDWICQVTPALDALREFDLGPVPSAGGQYTRSRALKGLLGVCMSETMTMEGHDRHTKHRKPKHVQARAILAKFASVLEEDRIGAIAEYADDRDVEADPAAVTLVRAVCDALGAIHVVMSDLTPAKKRLATFSAAMAA